MCTVSIVPLVGGFHLMCNRDERLQRPDALPPETREIGTGRATFPIDPVGGGTWIAANDAGLAFALLNRNAASDPEQMNDRKRSRGDIIPLLLDATRLSTVRRRLRRVRPAQYEPFQLVVVGDGRLLVANSAGRALEFSVTALDGPVMFTSSSLGDRDAERVRRPLFDSLVHRTDDRIAGQRRFHDHRWPGCTAFSVRMCRADSRTVSRSTVLVYERQTTFAYEALQN